MLLKLKLFVHFNADLGRSPLWRQGQCCAVGGTGSRSPSATIWWCLAAWEPPPAPALGPLNTLPGTVEENSHQASLGLQNRKSLAEREDETPQYLG